LMTISALGLDEGEVKVGEPIAISIWHLLYAEPGDSLEC
jgi:hypothetical protein